MRIMSPEEKRDTLSDIKSDMESFPIVPYIKNLEMLRDSLGKGNVDFIVDVEYWPDVKGSMSGIVRPIKPWENAELGFQIRSITIEGLIETVTAVVAEICDDTDVDFIYFRCSSPQMPFNRTCYVENAMSVFSELEFELATPGDKIRSEYYDC